VRAELFFIDGMLEFDPTYIVGIKQAKAYFKMASIKARRSEGMPEYSKASQ